MENIKPKKVSLIIPTLNERENIIFLLKNLKPVLNGDDTEIIVVDDDSPDLTWKIVEDYRQGNNGIAVIRRLGKRSLSGSIIDGFKDAKGQIIGVIDADMSHDITKLPEMIKEIERGCELVVGSRRIKGGGAYKWPVHRKLMSDIATFLTKFLLNLKLTDPMSGFFVLDRSLYEKIRDKLSGKGYKILIEIYILGKPQKIKEIPFIFKDRHQGYSKLSLKVIIEFFKMLFELKKAKDNESLKELFHRRRNSAN